MGSVAVTLSPAAAIVSTYAKCDSNNAPLNVVHFASPPPAGTKITVSYDVDVHGVKCP